MPKPRLKILVVDDDPVMVRLAARLLKNDGYDVFTAFSGEEGLAEAKAVKPDLILLDILMPDLDGKEVARRLRRDSETKDIPIVFMTVTIDLEVDKGNQTVGVDSYNFRGVAKPLHNRKILSVIRKEINKRIHGNT
jgi:CheY-like chemotaxis protein